MIADFCKRMVDVQEQMRRIANLERGMCKSPSDAKWIPPWRDGLEMIDYAYVVQRNELRKCEARLMLERAANEGMRPAA